MTACELRGQQAAIGMTHQHNAATGSERIDHGCEVGQMRIDALGVTVAAGLAESRTGVGDAVVVAPQTGNHLLPGPRALPEAGFKDHGDRAGPGLFGLQRVGAAIHLDFPCVGGACSGHHRGQHPQRHSAALHCHSPGP